MMFMFSHRYFAARINHLRRSVADVDDLGGVRGLSVGDDSAPPAGSPGYDVHVVAVCTLSLDDKRFGILDRPDCVQVVGIRLPFLFHPLIYNVISCFAQEMRAAWDTFVESKRTVPTQDASSAQITQTGDEKLGAHHACRCCYSSRVGRSRPGCEKTRSLPVEFQNDSAAYMDAAALRNRRALLIWWGTWISGRMGAGFDALLTISLDQGKPRKTKKRGGNGMRSVSGPHQAAHSARIHVPTKHQRAFGFAALVRPFSPSASLCMLHGNASVFFRNQAAFDPFLAKSTLRAILHRRLEAASSWFGNGACWIPKVSLATRIFLWQNRLSRFMILKWIEKRKANVSQACYPDR